MITICPFRKLMLPPCSYDDGNDAFFYGAAVRATVWMLKPHERASKDMDMLLALHDGTLAGFRHFQDLFRLAAYFHLSMSSRFMLHHLPGVSGSRAI